MAEGGSMYMIQEPRKHHYVPQWYLRRFGSKREIGVYDKVTGTLEVLRPKDVAYVEGLYDLDNPDLPRSAVETLLSNIENCAARAFRQLVSSGLDSLSATQREDIAAFVAAQQLRVPSHRKELMGLVHDLLTKVRAGLSDDEIRRIAHPVELTAEQLTQIRGPRQSSGDLNSLVAGGLVVMLPRFTAELLSDYRWSMITFDRPGLITSDTPVKAMTERDATGGVSVFVDLPIDPSHALLLQTGLGGTATALRGGPDAWYRDEEGTPSIRTFQNINFMKAERLVFGHPANPIWVDLGLAL